MTPIDDDGMLTPREVARAFGVAVVTVSRWAREGKLLPAGRTPGGQRRYRSSTIRALITERADPDRDQMVADAVRLYDQGRSIRQVAAKFDSDYGRMRRILRKHTTLRPPNGGK